MRKESEIEREREREREGEVAAKLSSVVSAVDMRHFIKNFNFSSFAYFFRCVVFNKRKSRNLFACALLPLTAHLYATSVWLLFIEDEAVVAAAGKSKTENKVENRWKKI